MIYVYDIELMYTIVTLCYTCLGLGLKEVVIFATSLKSNVNVGYSAQAGLHRP